ncbi:hypothetical protein [Trichormus variabilis]|uniref:Uncharacterized protein n=1 Tax=Trichormus variabilis SAG 1403-4b TaxID=447716 RepID=A0A3S1IAS1_ANAVA|nr:hypothetical protein [Trichormus variabilis]MBD2628942.1 hypothetical protein [Trichormus variabilis FACHB-164]RUS94562.1 hypothetical protein DSM107003_36910 [Trichormus variabilis SAG 1403-4b]
MLIICPKCQSDNSRKLSLIYQENVTHSTSTVRGSIGSKSAAAYKNETNATSLGKIAAPPEKPKSNIILIFKTIFITWIGIIVFTIFKALVLIELLIFLVFPIYLFWALRKNILYSRKYPKLYKKWDNSFMCQRCGTIFEG